MIRNMSLYTRSSSLLMFKKLKNAIKLARFHWLG